MPVFKNKPKFLRVVAWNANSINSKLQEFKEFLARFKVDVALISETHLKPCHRANIANYSSYRNDRLTGRGGGTAIYIKHNIDHVELPLSDILNIEISAVQINTARGQIALVAGYNPPSKPLSKEDFKHIFSLATSVILSGDLNSKHSDWHSNVNNACGNQLKKIADDLDFIVMAPDTPTRIPTVTGYRADVLDIVAYKNTSISPIIEAVDELSSDHLPILFTWGSGSEVDHRTVIKYKTSWRRFGEHLADFSPPENLLTMEENVSTLEKVIQGAHNQSTTSRITSNSIDEVPEEILNLIRARRKAIKMYKYTLSPQHKVEKNRLDAEVKSALDELRNTKWQIYLESLQPENGTLWTMAKNIRRRRGRIGVLQSADATAITDMEKAEMFADSIFKIADPTLSINNLEHLGILQDMSFNMFRKGTDIYPATVSEVQGHINTL